MTANFFLIIIGKIMLENPHTDLMKTGSKTCLNKFTNLHLAENFNMRILIVEDETELADGLEAILSRENYSVDVVSDGESGLDYILSKMYDLVILDIMLPKMNGIDILKATRKEGIDTPIILLTARSQLSDKIEGLDSGADDYITKPFDAQELLARIRARTRVPGSASTDDLSFGDIVLSKHQQQLSCGERLVKLGNKEYQLMECLMINSSRIMPKDMLITKVWGPLDATEYNNLEVYISFLRKKLRFIKASVQIVTTKNVGYSLEVCDNG